MGVEADVVKGLYRVQPARNTAQVRLVGSGTILREVLAAATMLQDDWGIAAEVWSATSYSELEREARDCERWNRLHPLEPARPCHLLNCLNGPLPIVAASDYLRAWPLSIAPYLQARMTALGTDGFGRSDTRAALRRFFEVDRQHIVLAALSELAQGAAGQQRCAQAIQRYALEAGSLAPWQC